MKIHVFHPNNQVLIGFIHAENAHTSKEIPELEIRLKELLQIRKANPLNDEEEHIRLACRNMLRFGSYKPTGRAKPASEYLLRTALDGQFPRINTLVDINNYISLKYVVPISLWDFDKAECSNFVFRPGKEHEEYVFNSGGQTISVQDLMAGFRIINEKEEPIVNPVKDSMLTKTDAHSTRIGVAVYFPTTENKTYLSDSLNEFTDLLEAGGAKILSKDFIQNT